MRSTTKRLRPAEEDEEKKREKKRKKEEGAEARRLLRRLLALPLEELPLEEALARVTAVVEEG